MGLLSWSRTRYRRRFRDQYNSGKYKKSLRNGRTSFRIFNDRIGLDVAARSSLRLRKYALASKLYRQATSKGWKLRDMHINHFEAELKSNNISKAYNIAIRGPSEEERQKQLTDVYRAIKKLGSEEREDCIREISLHHNLPDEFAEMAPEISIKVRKNGNNQANYTALDRDEFDVYKYRRELHRMRTSPSYRIGKHFVDAYRNPLKLISLPLSLPYLGLNLIRERGKPVDEIENIPSAPLMELSPNRRSIVLFPTNGVGFGHFTRLLSIAKKLRAADPELEIVFFTTMPTLNFLEDEGFPTYHIPGRYRYQDMEPREWNSIAEEVLSMVFTLHRPSAFIFDGAYPYRGMLNSLHANQDILRIWLRRGSIKKDAKSIPEDSLSFFDAVIKPGDSVSEPDDMEIDSGVPIVRCNPITILDTEKLRRDGTLRRRMGVPPEALLAYVQLGAGRINNIASELKHVLEALNEHPNVYTIYGESILGERNSFDYERVRTLRDYPNSQFFGEFDFAIMAAGYNSFHEAIQASLPTICFPNLRTGRDDQLARANVAKNAGCMVVLENRTRRKIRAAVDRIMDRDVRIQMSENSKILQSENGSDQIANWILGQLPEKD